MNLFAGQVLVGVYIVFHCLNYQKSEELAEAGFSQFGLRHLLDLSYVSHIYGVLVNLAGVTSSYQSLSIKHALLFAGIFYKYCLKRGAEELTSENCPFCLV